MAGGTNRPVLTNFRRDLRSDGLGPTLSVRPDSRWARIERVGSAALAKDPSGSVSSSGQLASSLRRLRHLREISQRELARRAHVSPDTVSQLERGVAQPTLDTLLRLQAGLNLPSLELLLNGQLAFASAELSAGLIPQVASRSS
jgi:DNA-binding XRE family transcriptional regulator